ncbi:MAG: pseudaminic acid biosynthesis-associated methylase [Syntrophales bacterium]
MKKYTTDQEAFWAGEFGNEYIGRNYSDDELRIAGRIALYSKMLARTVGVKSVLEFGANIGANVRVIKQLIPKVKMSVIEINEKAAAHLRTMGLEKVYNMSALEFKPARKWDIVITSGLLIHINPDALPRLYKNLYESSGRYVFICEYYNPTPVAIEYRGHKDRLFKRDFAGDMLDKYSDLRLIDYGFSYHRDPVFPVGDATWFLLEKTI